MNGAEYIAKLQTPLNAFPEDKQAINLSSPLRWQYFSTPYEENAYLVGLHLLKKRMGKCLSYQIFS